MQYEEKTYKKVFYEEKACFKKNWKKGKTKKENFKKKEYNVILNQSLIKNFFPIF